MVARCELVRFFFVFVGTVNFFRWRTPLKTHKLCQHVSNGTFSVIVMIVVVPRHYACGTMGNCLSVIELGLPSLVHCESQRCMHAWVSFPDLSAETYSFFSPVSFFGVCFLLFLDFAAQTDAQRKKRTFKKFSFRGKDLEGLLQLSPEETMDLLCARARRKFRRGTSAAEVRYMKKLRKAKAAAVEVDGILEKPATVKTHMRNMTIVPEMVGCVCGVYSGKHYVTVEVKVR